MRFKHNNLISKPIKQNNNKMISITTQFKSLENEKNKRKCVEAGDKTILKIKRLLSFH
jgi:hypothetical protein